MKPSKISSLFPKKKKRIIRLRLEIDPAEEHKNKKIGQIKREILGNQMKSHHGITGKVLGIDGEWGIAKDKYTVWLGAGKLLYLLAAFVTILIMTLGFSRFPELLTQISGTIILALSIWLLGRDIWNGWIGVSPLQAVITAAALAASWEAPFRLSEILFN